MLLMASTEQAEMIKQAVTSIQFQLALQSSFLQTQHWNLLCITTLKAEIYMKILLVTERTISGLALVSKFTLAVKNKRISISNKEALPVHREGF